VSTGSLNTVHHCLYSEASVFISDLPDSIHWAATGAWGFTKSGPTMVQPVVKKTAAIRL
jgi:hypothetical protein